MNIKKSSIFLLSLPAILIYTGLYLFRGIPFEDDAYIFYRYASNWADGLGPVYNAGEHVEGYSSFLWTAILAVGKLMSLDPATLAPVLNLVIGILCIFLLGYILSLLKPGNPRITIIGASVFCALSYGFYYYGASGMDSLIFSLVLMYCIISVYESIYNDHFLNALPSLILLNLVRAEGFMYSFILVFIMVRLVAGKEHSVSAETISRYPKKFIIFVLVFAGVSAGMFAVRYLYYHELIPATILAKGYGTFLFKKALLEFDFQSLKKFIRVLLSGLKYEFFFFVLGLWIPFIVLLVRRKFDDSLLWLIAAVIAVNIFVSVWAGGDYFHYERHFVAVLPVMIILMSWLLQVGYLKYRDSGGIMRNSVLTVFAILIIAWGVFFFKPNVFAKSFSEENRSLYLKQIGTALRESSGPTVMLSQMIGKISYYAGPGVYVRDVLGLTDIHNATKGEEWGFNFGKGACGRTDLSYSFGSPFDVFFYNSKNMHRRFIDYCSDNVPICDNYRFFKTDSWLKTSTYMIVNIKHPVAIEIEKHFGAVPLRLNEDTRNMVDLH